MPKSRARLRHKSRHRFQHGAVGEYFGGERLLADAQMIRKHALDYGAQIGGGFEIAALVQRRRFETRL